MPWADHIVRLERRPVQDLSAHPMNFRKHPEAQRRTMAAALDEVGKVAPLVENLRSEEKGWPAGTDPVLIDGHLRMELALERGEDNLPVVVVDLTEHQEQLALATLDPIGAQAEPDKKLLAALLDAAQPESADLTSLLNGIVGIRKKPGADPGPQVDKGEELREKWQTELGQLWEIPSATIAGASHRLLCGDSTSAEDVAQLMDGQRAELCATDPPYLVDYDGTNHPMGKERLEQRGGKDGNKHWDAYKDPPASVEFFSSFIRVALDVALVDNPAFYQWHASKRQALVESAWEENGLFVHQQLIWAKSRAILTRSHFMWRHEPCFYGWVKGKPPSRTPPCCGENSTVWSIDQAGESDGIHPTQKPLEVFTRPITYHIGVGDICFEPFSGSGSQLVAAEQEGRRCYALELEPAFVAAALERLAGMGLSPELAP